MNPHNIKPQAPFIRGNEFQSTCKIMRCNCGKLVNVTRLPRCLDQYGSAECPACLNDRIVHLNNVIEANERHKPLFEIVKETVVAHDQRYGGENVG